MDYGEQFKRFTSVGLLVALLHPCRTKKEKSLIHLQFSFILYDVLPFPDKQANLKLTEVLMKFGLRVPPNISGRYRVSDIDPPESHVLAVDNVVT